MRPFLSSLYRSSGRARCLANALLASALLGLAASVLVPSGLAAQSSASTTMTAGMDIVPALVMASTQSLSFGKRSPGSSVTVAVDDALSSRFYVDGANAFTYQLYFSIPYYQTATGATSADQATITAFNVSVNTTNASGGTLLVTNANPQSGPVSVSYTLATGTRIYLRMGASITIPASATPGAYSLPWTFGINYQ
jgi:hypothetical protein